MGEGRKGIPNRKNSGNKSLDGQRWSLQSEWWRFSLLEEEEVQKSNRRKYI